MLTTFLRRRIFARAHPRNSPHFPSKICRQFTEKPREFIDIYRIFRKFHIFERSDRLRYHTGIPRIRVDAKCGQMRVDLERDARNFARTPGGSDERFAANAGKCAPRARDEYPDGRYGIKPDRRGVVEKPRLGSERYWGLRGDTSSQPRRRPQNLILSRRASAVSKDGRRLPSCESASFDTPPSAATQDEEDGSGACPERSRGAATQDEGDVRTFSTTPARGRSRSRADSRVRPRAIDALPPVSLPFTPSMNLTSATAPAG